MIQLTATNDHHRAAAMLLTIAATIGGCATADPGTAFVERDSAGVRIAESARSLWDADPALAWHIHAQPSLVLGGEDGEPRFTRIAGVTRLAGGGIAVADMATNELHLFDAGGVRTRTIAPVDLPAIVYGVTRLYRSGNELFVAQRGLEPTLVFDTAGRFVRSVQPLIDDNPFIAYYHVLADRSFIAIQSPHGLIPRSGVWTENASFIHVPADSGEAERILTMPGVRFARVAGGVEPLGYGPTVAFDIDGDRFHAAFPQAFDIGTWSTDGRLLRRTRRAWQPVAVSPADTDSLREQLRRLGGPPSELPEIAERQAESISGLVVADTFPAHGRLFTDASDHLWVERVPPSPLLRTDPRPVRDAPSPWDVFDPRGQWLGTVDAPAFVYITEAGDDWIAGILREPGRADRAVIHRIDRPARLAFRSPPNRAARD